MGICVTSLYGDSTNVRKKDRQWVQDDCKVYPVTLSKAKSPFPDQGFFPFGKLRVRMTGAYDSHFAIVLTVGQDLFKVMFESG